MNREIKFRAWDKRYDLMIGPSELIASDTSILSLPPNIFFYQNAYLHFESSEQWIAYFKENLIAQQFTGFKDKSGKEIYDGDIIYYDNQNVPFTFLPQNCPIFWHETDTAHGWHFRVGGFIFLFGRELALKYSKVIGNIFENPELLA